MKNCTKCGRSIKKGFGFCPYCGKSLDIKNNWGILGKNDHILEQNHSQNNSIGSLFGGGIFNKMIGNAMKLLEKELQKDRGDSDIQLNAPKTKVQLYINGKKINIGTQSNQPIKVNKKQKINEQIKGIPSSYFSKENLKKFSNLPKESPKTSIRRLSDRIMYDLEMPDVKSIKDISIVNLENSIEIKAIGKNKSYYNVIKIGLPVIDYYLSTGKLILELGMKN